MYSFFMKTPLYLLDGYNLIYRSYFAFFRRPLRNPQGRNSSAIFGFYRSLLSLFHERRPALFALVLDSRTPTFRHELFPEYKATRQKTPEDLRAQIPVIEEIALALGVPTLRADGFEADDVMASLARACREEGRPCFVVSGDKDLLQIVGGETKILRPDKGGFREMGPREVYEDWGVRPEQIVDYLALAGDSSDNVPGAKGIGEKTAAALLSQFGDLDALYSRLEEVKSPSQRARLQESRDQVLLSRRLVTLREDVPLPGGPGSLVLPPLRGKEAAPLFLQEGMRTLAEELSGQGAAPGETGRGTDGEAGPAGAGEPSGAASAEASAAADGGAFPQPDAPAGTGAGVRSRRGSRLPGAADQDLFSEPGAPPRGEPELPRPLKAPPAPGIYRAVRSPEELDLWVSRAREAGTVAFDTETTGIDPMTAELVGFSLSLRAGEACYVPVTAPAGEGLGLEAVLPRLKTLMEDPEVRVVGQNIKFDYKVLHRLGVRLRPWFDTMIAAWLLDADAGSYGMDRLAEVHLGMETLRYDSVVPKGATFDQVPLEAAVRYAAEDADVTYRLHQVFAPRLRERGLDKLFHELEMPLVRILGDMEIRGIALNPGVLEDYGAELEKDLAALEGEIYRLCGREFNIASTKQLQEILFQVRRLTPTKKTKTGFSTDTSVLEELAREDPVPEKILRHRTLSKLKSTYVDALPRLVNPETGRLHTSFNQTGTATGRLSSRDPNLQNIPVKEAEGRRIRGAFAPAPGHLFLSADYAQIELVVLAHLSGDPGLKAAFAAGADVHRSTGALIFGVPEAEVTPEQRRIAKTINFGVMYGMSSFRLARELSIPRADADRFIASYFARYRGIEEFIRRTVAEAEKTGGVKTILGRERPIPAITSRNKTEKTAAERIAVNTPIQGSAADIVKLAMLRVDRRLREELPRARLLLQVHDELIFEVPREEAGRAADLVREEMESALKLEAPLRVSIETGLNWGEMH